jgi:hypothetical protein
MCSHRRYELPEGLRLGKQTFRRMGACVANSTGRFGRKSSLAEILCRLSFLPGDLHGSLKVVTYVAGDEVRGEAFSV